MCGTFAEKKRPEICVWLTEGGRIVSDMGGGAM